MWADCAQREGPGLVLRRILADVEGWPNCVRDASLPYTPA